MYIAIKSALAIIRRKKAQSVLIGIIIMLISALLYTGVSMVSQDSSFEDMAVRANAADTLLIATEKSSQDQEVVNWYLDQEAVEGVLVYQADMLNCKFGEEDNEDTAIIFLAEYNNDGVYDNLYIDEDTLAEPPKAGEVMINYNFAKNHGLNIGDKIKISLNDGEVELVISALVVDPHFSTPFLSPNRCFVNSNFFEENQTENQMEIIAIKYNTVDDIDDVQLYEQCLSESQSEYNAIFLGYNDIKSTYSIIFSIIAAVLIAVSLVIFVIVVFVIRSTIQNLIRKRYKEIGVQKAIGYTSKQIRNSLLMVYCLIGAAASILGTAAALPIRNIINNSVGYDMQVNVSASVDLLLFLNVGIIVALLSLFTMIAAKKTVNVKPVQAIKYGMAEQNSAATSSYSVKGRKGDLGLLLSVKQMLGSGRKTFSMILLLVLLTFGGFLIRNLGTTFASPKHFASNMFGIEIGDFVVEVDAKMDAGEVMKKIKKIEGVGNVLYATYSLSESFETLEESSHTIAGFLVAGNLEDYLILKTGRQPVNKNEVVISEIVSIESGKGIGDYITILHGDEYETYLVSGIYNSITSSGYSYAKKIDAAQAEVRVGNGSFWCYFDADNMDLEALEKEMKRAIGSGANVKQYDNNTSSVLSTLESFPLVVGTILAIFLVVSGIILLNFTIMDINNSVKVYGIMKATGFSREFISRMLVLRSMIITIAGMAIGFTACMISMNSIMVGVFKLTPFSTIRIPVILDWQGSVLIGISFIAIAFVSPLIATKRLDKITPKQLIAE